MPHDSLGRLCTLTRQLSTALLSESAADATGAVWSELRELFAQQTGSSQVEMLTDALAQAVTCMVFGWSSFRPELSSVPARQWLLAQADPLVWHVLRLADPATDSLERSPPVRAAIGEIAHVAGEMATQVAEAPSRTPVERRLAVVHFYERFLRQYDRGSRRRRGVFYTPQPLVAFVVRCTDELLRRHFALAHGLGDRTTWRELQSCLGRPAAVDASREARPFVRILDPAMGTGTFLLEVVAQVHHDFEQRVCREHQGRNDGEPADWNAFVAEHLLPQLWGQELLLPAVALAQLAMAQLLAETGFRFNRPARLHLTLGNTLQRPDVGPPQRVGQEAPFTIVLGNPPYSGVSHNHHAWIHGLLRGRDPETGACVADYFQSAGEPLRERKHWLQDDYVKFMRLAHWRIERAGAGIVALVTNHGYLDNLTFRGMREQLLGTFPRITVVDLHGNIRNGEEAPATEPDQSLFDIGQGVAVSLLCRPPTTPSLSSGANVTEIRHCDLWGARDKKLRHLSENTLSSLKLVELQPQAPEFCLAPRRQADRPEYSRGFPLNRIMPLHSTAVVTARDRFVIAASESELRERMAVFRDERISDTEVRQRYFGSTRSSHYQPGDTRGWRVADARAALRDDPQWDQPMRSCLYRPFDQRAIYWSAAMIDWPRQQVMDHLLGGNNLALIARRQTPPSSRCTYFWATDCIVIDGVIRSDNRGGESVFPLLLREPNRRDLPEAREGGRTCTASEPPAWRSNFADEFLEHCEQKLELRWAGPATTTDDRSFGPHDLFGYIYALFHSPSYRQRFADALRGDFPRVLIPCQASLFFRMSALGARLIDLHLMRAHLPAGDHAQQSSGIVAPGYPRYRDAAIWFNSTESLGPVTPDVWEFRVGTYQVCRKWLKDRRHHPLTPTQQTQYRQIVAALGETCTIMRDIDQALSATGGWTVAF